MFRIIKSGIHAHKSIIVILALTGLALWLFLPNHLRRLIQPAAHAMTFTVTNTNDSGAGSLRQAILDSNASAGTNTITFSIGSGLQTISPMSALPAITDAVIIDGTSQPGFAGTPIIELNGTNAGAGVAGLTISANNCTVKGLVINRFAGNGINLNTDGNLIAGNYIGTNVAGTVALGNLNGVSVLNASNNTIGGTTAAARNVISGNHGNGVQIPGITGSGNLVEGNFIGTTADGASALGNGTTGIETDTPNTIGGTTSGARNVISSNGYGIDVNGGGNVVQGNFIGTNAAGTAALGNTNDGVLVEAGNNSIIGGTAAGAGNLISGNNGSGVNIITGNGHQVQGNFIGTNAAGTAAIANKNGIQLSNVSGNTIGGTVAGAGNLISGNVAPFPNGYGIVISGNSATNNLVQGNLIGTNANGTAKIPNGDPGNTGGISLGGSNNTIGGTAAGARNVISGNNNQGIDIAGTSNVVQGNFIGTDITGNVALGNFRNGIAGGGSNHQIGGTSAAARNVISGNGSDGIFLLGAGSGNQIQGNYIGVKADGTGALANSLAGVGIAGLSNNTIGGTAAGAGNVISGNFIGVDLLGSANTGNQVQGNYIGLNPAGTVAMGNSYGLYIESGAHGNTIGGLTAGARNVISGNTSSGLNFVGSSTTGNQVQGNFIGTNAAGSAAIANGTGVRIDGAPGNTIGGTTAAARNIISGNSSDGVDIINAGATGNLVQGNFIGTDVNGTAALANHGGVSVGQIGTNASNVTIGGTAAGAGNLISGNTGDGVSLFNDLAGVNVQGNLIGTDVTGTAKIGNLIGIDVNTTSAGAAIIGGTTAAARNIISGNQDGFDFNTLSTGVIVQGNYIGTDITGNNALGNSARGMFVSTSNTTIGGTAAGAGNVISANGDGIEFPNGVTGNVVQGNFIGTRADGVGALGNTANGINIFTNASNNTIGGTAAGAGNKIAFNTLAGVAVDTGTGNAILGNSIFSNGRLGIDLSPVGVNPNHNCGSNSGPNNLENYPVLTSATAGAVNTTINGTLNSKANTQFRIEFFANPACDPSGNGQGKTFLGFTNVTTDGSCNASFMFVMPNASVAGPIITATATDPNNNTSEFSACVTDVGIAGALQFSQAAYTVNEGCATANITVNRTGSTSGPVTVDFATSDGTALQRTSYTLAIGTLTFNSGDTSKTFPVLITKDAYRENPNASLNLSLSNANGGAALGAQSTSTLTIIDDTTVATNSQPVDDAGTFVCQHYHDFLSREPDQSGLAYWTSQITQCGSDQTCIRNKRIDVSNAFFFELEYQQTAAYVFRLWRAAYGNSQPFPNPDNSNPTEANKLPSYVVFSKDRARLIGSSNLAQDQLALGNLLVTRAEFLSKYPANLTGSQFISAVLQTIQTADGADLSSQTSGLMTLYNNAGGGNAGRGAVMYRLADDNINTNPINNRPFIDAEYNRAFVYSQYAGYLRRDADIGGFLFWLGQVGNCPLRNVGAQHAMVCSFITSIEYQQRFSAQVTHTNAECPQGVVCSP